LFYLGREIGRSLANKRVRLFSDLKVKQTGKTPKFFVTG